MYNSPEACLPFNQNIRYAKLATKSWQTNNNFDWINIMSNSHQTSFFIFNKLNNIFNAKSNSWWTLCYDFLLPFNAVLCAVSKTFFLCLASFRTIFIQKLEELSG
uniref:Uncharacterized protein n=1 Tax=Meloidogyne incognita TaxID=6306 RepID=A0A914KIJ0_MELIC